MNLSDSILSRRGDKNFGVQETPDARRITPVTVVMGARHGGDHGTVIFRHNRDTRCPRRSGNRQTAMGNTWTIMHELSDLEALGRVSQEKGTVRQQLQALHKASEEIISQEGEKEKDHRD